MKYKENGIIISEEDLTKKIEDFPLEVVCKMVYNAALQENDPYESIKIFQETPESDSNNGAFNWGDSLEGVKFWSAVISNKKFTEYFNKYPKCNGTYIIEQSDNFPWIKPEMPEELIQLVIRTADMQGRREQLEFDKISECFIWSITLQGPSFWGKINKGDYSVFTKSIKINENESKLQREKSIILRGIVPEGCVLYGKKSKSSITVGPLSFRKCIGC